MNLGSMVINITSSIFSGNLCGTNINIIYKYSKEGDLCQV